ncbi:related to Surfeit locus protein 1 [Ustilago trichophora]|uniref:SURF1-like protein n=1 Tax=Ustilago trichophora TaxID=86804 RepID=A0A5C3E3M3_9BASI|nr:related to Surfeit locus protein 1 [Ustilago trichophora]
MKATPQLQRALSSALDTALSAGPSRPITRFASAALRLQPVHTLPLAHLSRSQPCSIRAFASTPNRRQDSNDNFGYTDAPEGYSKSTSSRSQKPWYRSPTTLVLGFIPIFTFGLGYWQIKRLKWKVSLIEELEDKLSRDPLRLPRNINMDVLPQFDFRLVSVKGEFDHDRAMFVGPRVREGVMGYHVVVPFRRAEGGGMVLINRGFVSEKEILGSGENRRLKDDAMPRGTQEFVALLPRVYPANTFTPDNKPEKGSWFHVNPSQMAEWASGKKGVQALSLENNEDSYTPSAGVAESVKGMLGGGGQSERVLPVYLEEVFDGNVGEAAARVANGIPVGRAATIELRNQHAVYAATWFSLSACTAIMFGLLVRRGRT